MMMRLFSACLPVAFVCTHMHTYGLYEAFRPPTIAVISINSEDIAVSAVIITAMPAPWWRFVWVDQVSEALRTHTLAPRRPT